MHQRTAKSKFAKREQKIVEDDEPTTFSKLLSSIDFSYVVVGAGVLGILITFVSLLYGRFFGGG